MFEIATSALLLVSTFYGEASTSANTTASVLEMSRFEHMGFGPMTVEERVREYYKDTPVLAEIARCESEFRHVDSKGNIIRGEINFEDIGIMQINEFYHRDKALSLGFNIYSLEGNLAYAKWLYEKYGSTPWSYSAKCWKA